MSGILVIALLLCLLIDGVYKATAWDDADFFSYCPPSRCSEHGPEIRYPFHLELSNTSPLCGVPCMKLACSGNDTILVRPPAVIPYKVTAIDYRHATLTVAPRVDDSAPSCGQKLMSVALPRSIMECKDSDLCSQLCSLRCATIVSCLREFTPRNRAADYIFGPISCLSSASHFSYLVDGSADLFVLSLDCKVVPDSFFLMSTNGPRLKEQAQTILNFTETTIDWWYYGSGDYNPSGDIKHNCTKCEQGGGRCGFSTHRNQTFCMNDGIISNCANHTTTWSNHTL